RIPLAACFQEHSRHPQEPLIQGEAIRHAKDQQAEEREFEPLPSRNLGATQVGSCLHLAECAETERLEPGFPREAFYEQPKWHLCKPSQRSMPDLVNLPKKR